MLSKNATPGEVPVVAGGLKPATYHNASNTTPPVLTISSSGANAGYVSLWGISVWSSDSSFIDSAISDNVYFWYVVLSDKQKQIYDSQTGSAQPHIYPQQINELPIGPLDDDLIRQVNNEITPLFEAITKNTAENRELENLRDALLPKLMSGEIDVSKVDLTQLNSHLVIRCDECLLPSCKPASRRRHRLVCCFLIASKWSRIGAESTPGAEREPKYLAKADYENAHNGCV